MGTIRYINQESMDWQYHYGSPELSEVARLRLAMDHSRAKMGVETDKQKKETLYKHILMCYRTYNKLKTLELV